MTGLKAYAEEGLDVENKHKKIILIAGAVIILLIAFSGFSSDSKSDTGNMLFEYKKQAEYEKWHKGIAAMLDLKTHPQFKQDGGDVYYIYKETLSNGFTIEYKSTLNHVNHSWRDSFVIEGAKAKDGDTEFKEFPEYKPGTIVYTEYGYSMTIVEFFQIVKRSGNTCYLKRIASKVVDGTDGMYGKKVAVKDTFIDNTIYSARLPKMKYKEKHSYFWLWNGKPIYFNHMD